MSDNNCQCCPCCRIYYCDREGCDRWCKDPERAECDCWERFGQNGRGSILSIEEIKEVFSRG